MSVAEHEHDAPPSRPRPGPQDMPRWGTPVDPDADLAALDENGGLRAGDLPGGGEEPVAVDSVVLELPAPSTGQRWRALRDGEAEALPPWATDPAALRESTRRVAAEAAFAAKYAAVRSPKLAAVSAWWITRGTGIAVYKLTRWVLDVDGHPLIGTVTASSDKAYHAMATARTKRQQFRFGLLGVLTLLAAAAVGVLWWRSPLIVVALAVAVAGVLARVGRPAGARLVSPAVNRDVTPRLTSQLIVRALCSLGIGPLTKALTADSSRMWRSSIVPVRGGYRVHIQLPESVVADDLVDHEQRLASALARPADTVIVEPLSHITPGDANLWIFDKPVLAADRGPGPLAKARAASWWKPVQLGHTRVGQVHTEHLRGGAWFVGGRPSSGKSSLCRIAAAHTALDPNALLVVVNLKGSPDYLPLKPVCHRYLSASPETDRTVLAETTGLLRWLLAECGRRNDFLVALVEKGRADTNDVTEELARRHPELRPMTVILDEVHRLIDKADNPEAEEAVELLGKCIKAVRSVAITMIAATQLAGVESIPASLTRAARVRGCLVVSDSVSFRQIYGDAGQGVFAASGVAKLPTGSVLLRSETGAALKVGCFNITAPDLRAIGQRALDLRTAMHTLTGEAAGEPVAGEQVTDPADLLRDVIEAIPGTAPTGGDDDAGVAWVAALETTLGRLDAYQGRAPGWLPGELRARQVPVSQLNRRVTDDDGQPRQRNQAGVRLETVRSRLQRLLTT